MDADEEDAEEDEDEYEEGSSSGKRRSLGSNGTPKKKRKLDVSAHFDIGGSALTKSSERRETSVTNTVCGYKNTTCQEHGTAKAHPGQYTSSQPSSSVQTTNSFGASLLPLCLVGFPTHRLILQVRNPRSHIPVHYLTNITN